MDKEIGADGRGGDTRIEVWRHDSTPPWYISVYPDPAEPGDPGHTRARQDDETPAGAPDEPDR